jgi:hypothetical protein
LVEFVGASRSASEVADGIQHSPDYYAPPIVPSLFPPARG